MSAGTYRLLTWLFHSGKQHPPGAIMELSHEDGARACAQGTAAKVVPELSKDDPDYIPTLAEFLEEGKDAYADFVESRKRRIEERRKRAAAAAEQKEPAVTQDAPQDTTSQPPPPATASLASDPPGPLPETSAEQSKVAVADTRKQDKQLPRRLS